MPSNKSPAEDIVTIPNGGRVVVVVEVVVVVGVVVVVVVVVGVVGEVVVIEKNTTQYQSYNAWASVIPSFVFLGEIRGGWV